MGRKLKKKYIESIPYCKGAGNEAAKYNIHVPVKLALNISQILKSDRDKVDPVETSAIYRIKYSKDNKTGHYIGLTKRKIKERVKEHKGDICNNRGKTSIAKIAQTKNISINITVLIS